MAIIGVNDVEPALGIMDAPEERASIGSDLNGHVFHLDLTAATKRAWVDSGIGSVWFDLSVVEPEDGHIDSDLARWTLSAKLGRALLMREAADGRTSHQGEIEVAMDVELRDDHEFNRIRAQTKGQVTRLPRTLVRAFHALVDALCSGHWPPVLEGLSEAKPANGPNALVGEGLVGNGWEVFNHAVDDWWQPCEVQLQDAMRAIDRGEGPRGIAIGYSKSGQQCLFFAPLVMDSWSAQLAKLAGPMWIFNRYWVELEVGGDSQLTRVAICSEEDRSFAAEGDAEAALGGVDAVLEDLLSTLAYRAYSWLTELS